MSTQAQTGPELRIEGSSTRLWIPVGAGLFLVALLVSALVVPQLRLLHFLQALIYLAVIVGSRGNKVWALGAGFASSVFCNSRQLFVTHLMQAGAIVFLSFLRKGQITRLDTMMVTLGGIGHFILIVACLVAFGRARTERKWLKFVAGGLTTLAYFALIVKIALPH